MGTLTYAGTPYEIDEDLLARLKIPITSKLRLREGFPLSWQLPAEKGSGRVSLWIAGGIPLEFRFRNSNAPKLSREWLEALERSSHGARGMLAMAEHEARQYLEAAGRAVAP